MMFCQTMLFMCIGSSFFLDEDPDDQVMKHLLPVLLAAPVVLALLLQAEIPDMTQKCVWSTMQGCLGFSAHVDRLLDVEGAKMQTATIRGAQFR